MSEVSSASIVTEAIQDRDPAPLLQQALACAEAGYNVFPLRRRGKEPLVRGGFKVATDNLKKIIAWWTKWPHANIGIATGAASGLLVVDIDSPEGSKLFQSLGALPAVPPVVQTGKGAHLYFRLPADCGRIKSSAADGLDIRADDGYVVAPPSIHPNGNAYMWRSDGPEAPVVAPAFLIDWARNRKTGGPNVAAIARRPNGKVGGTRSLVGQIHRTIASSEPYSEPSGARLRSALAVIPAVERQVWMKVGMALQDLTRGDPAWALPARRLWDEWSETCPDPNKKLPGGQDKAWASFGRNFNGPRVTVATIFGLAKEAGWVDPASSITVRLSAADTSTVDVPPSVEPAAGVDLSLHLQNDVGNREIFHAMFGKELRYVEPWRCWLAWEGSRWVEKSDLAMIPAAVRCSEEILRLAVALPADSPHREKWIKHALASLKEARLWSTLNLAKAYMLVEPKDLDRDPMLLGCPNGTLDLRNGDLREARREDLITKQIAVPYDPAAECPRWLAFLEKAMQGDGEAMGFLQRLAGYALTGEVREELMPVLIGNGANGKSTFLMTLLDLLGDYASKAQSDLLVQGQGKAGAASPDVAALHGKRLVIVSETEDGCMLSEARVKDIVSNERIAARRLHRDPFEFAPTHKIFLATNHRPRIRGTDNGIWRRVGIVPFCATFGEAEKITDFREKVLRPELAGILRWAVEGCLKWASEGLCPPTSVQQATAAYRSEMDTVAQWADDRTARDATATVPLVALYGDYVSWAQMERTSPLGKRRFSDELDRLGYPQKGKGGTRVRRGIKLQMPPSFGNRGAKTPEAAEDAKPVHR